LDGQILWDPYGTCEPQHGVTTMVMGNCGLSLAPVKAGIEDAIVKSFRPRRSHAAHRFGKGGALGLAELRRISR
jgi:hypothetical protein